MRIATITWTLNRNPAAPSDEELCRWADSQRRTLKFDPPPLLPGEGPITIEQLAEIRHLTKDTDVSAFQTLGCGQAQALIFFMREQRDIFTQDLINQALAQKYK